MHQLKQGTARDILELMEVIGVTNYYELHLATGEPQDKLRRAVKYLRTEGYLIRTITKAGRYSADLELVGRQ